jgi:hypothetical protein
MARKTQDMRKLEAREAELTNRIAADQAELEEIRVARKVLGRLAGEEKTEPETPSEEETEPSVDIGGGVDASVGDLALMLLRQAAQKGMTSGEILDAIHAKWLPGLARTSLSPPLSRLKKKSVIKLVGDRWMIAAENEAKSTE